MACTCVKQEVGEGKGNVKGYVVTTLCSECEAKRAADALIAAEKKASEDARLFLVASDWKVIRHRDQLAQGITTSLTEAEYLALLEERQTKRALVI